MSTAPAAPVAPASNAARRATRWWGAATGLLLGVLGWAAMLHLNLHRLPGLRGEYLLPVLALLGAGLGMTRFRPLLWVGSGFVGVMLLLVALVPWWGNPTRGLVRQDPVRLCEAVVVLSTDVLPNGSLDSQFMLRLFRALELARQGQARRLVITRLPPPRKSALPAVQAQIAALRFDLPVDEIGPIGDTHDEAVGVAKLARERGWSEVLLVTDPTHTRRAAATFERAGIRVLAQPSGGQVSVVGIPRTPEARLDVFRDWLYETAGWELYRWRGWL